MFVDRLPLKATWAECMAAEGQTKFIPRRLGPYRILTVTPEDLKILQSGIENIVSGNWAAPTSTENIRNDAAQYSLCGSNKHDDSQLGTLQEEVNNTQEGGLYVVENVIKRADTPESRHHLVCWYRYTSVDVIPETDENLPKYFIGIY